MGLETHSSSRRAPSWPACAKQPAGAGRALYTRGTRSRMRALARIAWPSVALASVWILLASWTPVVVCANNPDGRPQVSMFCHVDVSFTTPMAIDDKCVHVTLHTRDDLRMVEGESKGLELGNAVKRAHLLTSLDVSGSNIDDAAVPFIMKSITQHGSWWRRAALYRRLPNMPRTSLRKLSLTNNMIGDFGAVAIAQMLEKSRSLQHLHLDFNQIGDSGAAVIASALRSNHMLETLDLRGNPIGPGGALALADALEFNKKLVTLHLGGCNIGNAGMEAVSKALKKNTALKVLDVEANGITADAMVELSDALAVNKHLSILDLSHNDLQDMGVERLARGLERIGKDCNIQTIRLMDVKMGDAGVIGLAEFLRVNHQLKRLLMPVNQLSSTGIATLAAALHAHPSLHTLDLSLNNNMFGGADEGGLKQVGDMLRSDSALLRLDLQSNGINARGAAFIARGLLNNSHIQHLNLAGNKLGSKGLQHLAVALKTQPSLRSIDLTATSSGDVGAQFIASALASNKRLQSFVLMLSRNGISDVGAGAMSPVLGLSSQMLSELHLEHNDITSKGGNSLVTGLGNNTALRILGLAGNDMDDSVLENLDGMLHKNHHLKEVTLYANDKMTNAAKMDTIHQTLAVCSDDVPYYPGTPQHSRERKCSHFATCSRQSRQHTCVCNQGYAGSGETCTRLNSEL